ncbi:oplophorus-luciferin 2-monooxygenase non-catalytic subunit-like [Daphnia carinata]|uniref:oplophorus-luciferin 2-monooxygenase non-catalytic subunit-like n=1 Tax=Daphnia carinata TaxID=120202 RepID=UPI002580EB6A|nr:oplophorus-luciferin 2-monooxygenase non-catalytic subunit-like [Daphnia carinata]
MEACNTWIAIIFILVAGTVPSIKAECEDYSPCTCGQNAEGNLYINCIDVLPTDIQAAFSRTIAPDIYNLVMILPASGGDIPADLLSGKRVLLIDIIGPSRDSFQLVMDPGALRSSSSYTKQLVISKCNLIQLDFSFLRGFSRLEELRLDSVSNIKPIENLPPLANLVGLAIDNSQGFEALTSFPAVAFSRLNHLYLYNDALNDLATGIILNAFVSSLSANTLEVLTLSKNMITQVPQQVTALPSLLNFALNNNNITLITTGALSLVAPRKVYLNNMSLDAIEADAFQGDYSYAEIDLTNNNLVSFDYLVFQPILTQMAGIANSTGTIYLVNNPFSCDCGLAWLIRDNPNLLKATSGATCANTTSFGDLNPGGYLDC